MCRNSFLIPVLFRIRKKTCLSLKIWEQEVSDDLSTCMMNILHKVSSLPSSLAINLMKIEIQTFQAVTWSHLGHLIKGSCLGASETMSAPSQYIFCRWRYVFICHLTQQDHSVEMSCAFMGESSSPHVTTLKSLVTIGILIFKRKNVSSKTSYNYILTPKNWVDWITNKQQKNIGTTKMVYFENKCAEI